MATKDMATALNKLKNQAPPAITNNPAEALSGLMGGDQLMPPPPLPDDNDFMPPPPPMSSAEAVGQGKQAAQMLGSPVSPSTESITSQISKNASSGQDAQALSDKIGGSSDMRPPAPIIHAPDMSGPGQTPEQHDAEQFRALMEAQKNTAPPSYPISANNGSGLGQDLKDFANNPAPLGAKILDTIKGVVRNINPLTMSANRAQPANLFANSTQAPTSMDDRINKDAGLVERYAKTASFGPLLQQRYQNAQAQLSQDKAQREFELSTMQNIGTGTPQQSQQFRDAALGKGAIIQSLQNVNNAMAEKNPQRIEGTYDELLKQGNLADAIKRMPGGSSILQAASEGTLMDYLTKIGPVAAQTVMKGILQAAYDNAGVEGRNVQRLGVQLGVDPGVGVKIDPYYGKEVSQIVPERDTVDEKGSIVKGFMDNIDKLDVGSDGIPGGKGSISQQRIEQQKQIAQQTGKSEIEGTFEKLKGVWGGLNDVAKSFIRSTNPDLGSMLDKYKKPVKYTK